MTEQQSPIAPPHKRLDGFQVKHLARVLSKLWKMRGQSGFDVFRDDRTNSKEKLVAFILSGYLPGEIDEAHKQAWQEYPNAGAGNGKPRRRRPGNGNGMPVDVPADLPSPQQLQQLSAPSNSASNGEAQSQPSQPMQQQQAPQQMQQPMQQSAGADVDPMAALAKALWPHLVPSVANVAFTGDKLTHGAIADALKKVAANAGAGGTVNGQLAGNVLPTVVQLQAPNMPAVSLGVQHFKMPLLLKMCNARLRNGMRLNIWVHGPAGTGKTYSAEEVAKAFGIPFHYNGSLMNPFQLLGYMDANGNYVSTAFRRAWEFGGVYLFDEIDGSTPDALLALNGALAGTLCSFPDKMVPRHKDCIILAGANTVGTGGTIEYSSRFRLDASTTDRFAFLDWPIDEALEAALQANNAWLARVRKIRTRAKAAGMKAHPVTPRATIYGEALLAAGLTWEETEAATLRKGLPADQWATLAAVA